MFCKKATKIDEISGVMWHYVVDVKSTVKISSIFVVFLENMNFNLLNQLRSLLYSTIANSLTYI